jgi:hypothetical protein
MVQKLHYELLEHLALLQAFAVLGKRRRAPHGVVGSKTNEPAIEKIVVDCSISWRSERMP